MAKSGQARAHPGITVQPSLFDMFYEEFLTQFMSAAADPNEISQDFMKLKTDLERAEFIMRLPFIRDFEIKNKSGIKCIEKAVKYREEGNKLFQSDQCTQAILFYNKSISYCPHPSYEQFQQGIEQEQEKVKEVQFADECKDPNKKIPSKYESLSLSYGNRSAALRKLNQYEDCLKDIARAAKFGYPKASIYKLWERKGKCYEGLKRYDLAAKCYRQGLQSVKESNLGEREKNAKTGEIQGLLKQLRSTVAAIADVEAEAADHGPGLEAGPGLPPAPDRPGRRPPARKLSPASPTSATAPGATSPMRKANSQCSISHLSTCSSSRPDIEVPELTCGPNPRLPSAALCIDVQYSKDRGRYFVATQDLSPGETIILTLHSLLLLHIICSGDVILREEPYAAALESVFRVNHCAHCLKKTATPISCFECATVRTMFTCLPAS